MMAYVDDVNCLLPISDVKHFLDSFKKHGEPLGAFMNTEKTRILTPPLPTLALSPSS